MKNLTEEQLKAIRERTLMMSPITRLWPRNPEHEKKVQDLIKSKGITRSAAVWLVDNPKSDEGS